MANAWDAMLHRNRPSTNLRKSIYTFARLSMKDSRSQLRRTTFPNPTKGLIRSRHTFGEYSESLYWRAALPIRSACRCSRRFDDLDRSLIAEALGWNEEAELLSSGATARWHLALRGASCAQQLRLSGHRNKDLRQVQRPSEPTVHIDRM